jgi:hypothetical protein
MAYNGTVFLHAHSAKDARTFDQLKQGILSKDVDGENTECIEFHFGTLKWNIFCQKSLSREDENDA